MLSNSVQELEAAEEKTKDYWELSAFGGMAPCRDGAAFFGPKFEVKLGHASL